MTRSDINNIVLAAAVGLLAMGGVGVWQGRTTEPDSPAPAPGPAPTTNLASLIEDASFRAELHTFYNDLADLIERDTAGRVETTEQFRNLHRAAAMLLSQNRGIQIPESFNRAISDRITSAITLEATELDNTKRPALVQALRSIAADLVK